MKTSFDISTKADKLIQSLYIDIILNINRENDNCLSDPSKVIINYTQMILDIMKLSFHYINETFLDSFILISLSLSCHLIDKNSNIITEKTNIEIKLSIDRRSLFDYTSLLNFQKNINYTNIMLNSLDWIHFANTYLKSYSIISSYLYEITQVIKINLCDIILTGNDQLQLKLIHVNYNRKYLDSW